MSCWSSESREIHAAVYRPWLDFSPQGRGIWGGWIMIVTWMTYGGGPYAHPNPPQAANVWFKGEL